MSSHHIVREKQEPALFLVDLDRFHPENLGQLLEWSPTVLVAEHLYEIADSLAIKVDAVLSMNPHLEVQESTRLISTYGHVLEDGLKYLVGEQYPAVNVVVDEFVLKDYLLFADLINLVVYTPEFKIYPVRNNFSKWKTQGEQIHLLQEADDLEVDGAYFLTDTVLETEKDGFMSLRFKQEFIFIAERY